MSNNEKNPSKLDVMFGFLFIGFLMWLPIHFFLETYGMYSYANLKAKDNSNILYGCVYFKKNFKTKYGLQYEFIISNIKFNTKIKFYINNSPFHKLKQKKFLKI